MIVNINSPTRHFFMRDVFVALDTEVSELEIDEGIGGNGEKSDEAGEQGIARNADGVRAAFTCDATIGCEIDAEKNQYGDNVQGESDLCDAEGRTARMSHDASDDLDGAFEGRCPEENPCRVDDGECHEATQEIDNP